MRVIYRYVRPYHLGFGLPFWSQVRLTFQIGWRHNSLSFLLQCLAFSLYSLSIWGRVLSPTYTSVWNCVEPRLCRMLALSTYIEEKHFLFQPFFPALVCI